MRRALPLVILAVACSGKTELPPHGEALFVVDTDVPVPQLAGRLRVDVFDESGAWIESRDIGRSDPRAFPASFSVYSDDDTKDKLVMVRLRVYPEGVARDYQGERYAPRPTFSEPPVATKATELCAAPAELPIGGRITLRRAGVAVTTSTANARCTGTDAAGSVAARVTIATKGTYRFSVANALPYVAESTLVLRASCADPGSQLDCDAQPSADVTSPGHFPRIDATLVPGTYFLVTGGVVPDWPADLTLEAFSLDDPSVDSPAAEAPANVDPRPRLRRPGHGADETPPREPLPSATIDRLVLVRLRPGARGSARVTLRGACTGTMAKLGADPRAPSLTSAATCVDRETELVPLAETPLDPDLDRRDPSVQGSFVPGASCEGIASDPEKVCVPGGAFVLGGRALSPEPGTLLDTVPERVAVMPRFFVDRHEVTVARLRDAVSRGLVIDPLAITTYDGTPGLGVTSWCTWSATAPGRDDLPVNCVGWRLARDFCRFEGGDLPTEAEWEYVALAAGRPYKTAQPWGDDEPDCLRAVVARSDGSARGDDSCTAAGLPVGPAKIDQSDRRDVSPQGIVGLSGSVSEWTLDSAASYGSACWTSAPLASPRCWEENAPLRIARGGSWRSEPSAILRRVALPGAVAGAGYGKWSSPRDDIGFRCVYTEGRR